MEKNTRRNFLKKVSVGSAVMMSIPQIVAQAYSPDQKSKVELKKGDTILFQGDSITDARRKKDEKDYNSLAGLGAGYAFLAAADLLHNQAGKELKIFNRGISGNKVYQLAERWDAVRDPARRSVQVPLSRGRCGEPERCRDDQPACLHAPPLSHRHGFTLC